MKKYFIEIGTSDFNTLEHLAEQGWQGIFVEPDAYYLNRLKRFDDCIYEQSAILDYDGTTQFINYDAEWASENVTEEDIWTRGVGTTNLDMNNMNSNPDWPTKEFEVKVKTLNTLVKEHKVSKIDFLKIDVEGADTDILYDYDFSIRPKTIKIEVAHHENFNVDVADFREYMTAKGYTLYAEDDFNSQDVWFFDNKQ